MDLIVVWKPIKTKQRNRIKTVDSEFVIALGSDPIACDFVET